MTQEQLAAEAGVERSYMGGIERGERNMSVVVLLKIMGALGCSSCDIFGEISILEKDS
jgi:transcriptional regulator with XRE-family HTH domain